MCLIIVKPKDVALPCDNYVTNANHNNDDGIGVAVKYASGQRVHIKKDFKTLGEFLEWMKKEVKPEDTMIIHFRWATSGKTDMGNRHPFPITRNKELLRKLDLNCGWAVAHNGVLTGYSGHKKYSDTQKFTLDILASPVIKDNLKDKTIQKMLEDFIGSDKLALLSEDGTVIRIGDFTKDDDGCFYSNDTYKAQRFTYNYHDCGGGFYGGHGYNQHIVSTPVSYRQETTEISKQGTIFFDNCDGCGKKKKLLEIDSTHFDGEAFFLCKSCRKQYRKGKLERLDEEIGENMECVGADISPTHIACDGCLEKHPKEEMNKSGDYFYCSNCCSDWMKLTKEGDTKILEDRRGFHNG